MSTEKKEISVSVRLSPLEANMLDTRCEVTGFNRSQYLRYALRRQKMTVVTGAAPILKQVILFGNNLNQINRALNSCGNVNVLHELHLMNTRISEIKEMLIDLSDRAILTRKELKDADNQEAQRTCKAAEDNEIYLESGEDATGIGGGEWL